MRECNTPGCREEVASNSEHLFGDLVLCKLCFDQAETDFWKAMESAGPMGEFDSICPRCHQEFIAETLPVEQCPDCDLVGKDHD